MYQQVVNPNKPRLNLLIMGGVRHGKTSLTAAITKVLALRGWANFQPVDQIGKTPEDTARGFTTVRYETANRQYAQVDCPTHSDSSKNMLTGTVQVDGAILVVAADEGPLPETSEQVQLARHAGVPSIVVFHNKMDMVDEEMVEFVESDVRELLTEYGFPGETVPVINGSALTVLESTSTNPNDKEYECIWNLLRTVDQAIPTPVSERDKPFLMEVQDVFNIVGRGTGVTGRIERGLIKPMQEVEIIGSKSARKVVVTGIEMNRNMIDQGAPGDNVSCILSGIDRTAIERG